MRFFPWNRIDKEKNDYNVKRQDSQKEINAEYAGKGYQDDKHQENVPDDETCPI